MAYKLAVESDAYAIGGTSLAYTTNPVTNSEDPNTLCTRGRAEAFGCETSDNASTNQWVTLKSLSALVTYDYIIEFNANGGTGTCPSSISKTGTSSSVVMGDISSYRPSRTGYTFRGWAATTYYSSTRIAFSSTTGGSSDRAGNSATTTSSSWSFATYCSQTGGDSSNTTLTLYALWEPIQTTVTFDPNGGTISNTNSGSGGLFPNTYTYSTNSSGLRLLVLTYDYDNFTSLNGSIAIGTVSNPGYTFLGWYDAQTGGNQVYNSSGYCIDGTYWSEEMWKYSGTTLTLFALWEGIEFTNTLTYLTNLTNANSGSPLLPAETTVTYPNTEWETTVTSSSPIAYRIILYNTNITGAPSPPLTRVSATFNGWAESTSGDVVYSAGDSITVGSNYVADDQTKTLYANWTYNSTTLKTATRSGYTLLGWYTASSGGTRVGGAGDSYFPTAATTTLYAHWEEIPEIEYYWECYDCTNGEVIEGYSGTETTTDTEYYPDAPDIEGYTYQGYYYGGAFDTSDTIDDGSTTGYADSSNPYITFKYTENVSSYTYDYAYYCITSGYTGYLNSTPIECISPNSSETFSAPTIDGYTYSGYSTSTSCSSAISNSISSTSSSCTLNGAATPVAVVFKYTKDSSSGGSTSDYYNMTCALTLSTSSLNIYDTIHEESFNTDPGTISPISTPGYSYYGYTLLTLSDFESRASNNQSFSLTGTSNSVNFTSTYKHIIFWYTADSSATYIPLVFLGLNTINNANVSYTRYTHSSGRMGTLYQFTAPSSGSYTFAFSGTGTSSTDTYGYLLDTGYTLLAYNDDSNGGSDPKITYNCSGGVTYYILITAYNSSSSGASEGYTITGTLDIIPQKVYLTNANYNIEDDRNLEYTDAYIYSDAITISGTSYYRYKYSTSYYSEESEETLSEACFDIILSSNTLHLCLYASRYNPVTPDGRLDDSGGTGVNILYLGTDTYDYIIAVA